MSAHSHRTTTTSARAFALHAVVTSLVVLAMSCTSGGEDRADLCRDLGNFEKTFELLLAPPADATIGEVRGALEKVAPFLDRIGAAESTPEAVDAEIVSVEEAFRDALDGLSDDESATRADEALRGDRPRLAALLSEASATFACGDAAS